MSDKIIEQVTTVKNKFNWVNGLIAFLVIALPQIVDYLGKTELTTKYPEAYGLFVLLVGLFTKFYIHQNETAPNPSEPTDNA